MIILAILTWAITATLICFALLGGVKEEEAFFTRSHSDRERFNSSLHALNDLLNQISLRV